MRKRLAILTAGILASLMALGTANALVIDTAPGAETTASEQAVSGTETTYEVGDAGTVTVTNDGTQLEILSVVQNAGWQIEIEVATGREVEVDFRNGTRRIQFNAELEDGEIRIRAQERVVAATNTTQSTTSTTAATQTTGSTAPATVASSSATGTTTYQAGAAGTVTISSDGSQLTITAVDAADGWSHEIEVRTGREVEMDFRRGGDRVQFNAELEDGQVRVRVRNRSEDGTRTEVTNGLDTTDDSSGSDDSVNDDSDSDDRDDNDSDDADSDDGQKGSDSDDNDDSSDDDSDSHSHSDNSGRGGSDHDDDRSDD
jgi:hypothetical protein